ncbi:MAG: DUF309 domain-containing protein [Gemmatimonadota bacterium]
MTDTGTADRWGMGQGKDRPMRHRSPPAPLAHFLELYSAGRFWASHEALEEEWFRTSSDFYQGLILYASAWVHWERRNAHGLRAQSIKALRRLDGYPSAYLGLDVEALRAHCIDLRDTVWPGFDAWGDVMPMQLTFSPERVLGTETELPG